MRTTSISQFIQVAAGRYGDAPALVLHGERDESYSYSEIAAVSGRLAGGLVGMGLQKGDRVAILSESRPRWGAAFFAAIRAGAIVVPLDISQTQEELAATLSKSQPAVLIVSGPQESAAATLAEGQRGKIQVFSLEPTGSSQRFPSIDSLKSDVVRVAPIPGEHEAAVLTFTSGTMGSSKGVVTTHGNLLFQVRAARRMFDIDSSMSAVSILPLSHLYELTAGFLGVLHGGGSICYCNSLLPSEIIDAMRARKARAMVVVPLFLKLFATSIQRKINGQNRVRRLLFSVMTAISPAFPPPVRRAMFSNLHACLGGNLKFFVSGGAPLDEDTRRFFENIGLPIHQGYGLAESSPVIASNCPAANRPGSVGKPLPGLEVKISSNGEVLTRGPHIMRGYFDDADLTASVIDNDGWLHTGDVGYLDDDGFLFINGREKNIIVLGSGKKVQPEQLEAQLFEHPFIEEGCVVGAVSRAGLMKDFEEVCAVAVASELAVRLCAERSQDLKTIILQVIEQQARRFPASQRPARVVLRGEPLPRTSTRKVRRKDVCRWLSQEPLSI